MLKLASKEYFEFATYASLAKSLDFLLFIEYYPDKKLRLLASLFSIISGDLDEFEEAIKKLEIS